MVPVPQLSKDLIEELDKFYPKATPHHSMTMQQIMFNAGARSVVDVLLARLKRQEENVLKSK